MLKKKIANSGVLVSQIVARSAVTGAIGKDNQLLWHVPADLKHFKNTTMAKPIIMGRKTYESVGFPLPGRTNIVITRDTSLQIEGVRLVNSCEEALELGLEVCAQQNIKELMIAGGAEIYSQTLTYSGRVYLSDIAIDIDGDAYYQTLPVKEWQQISSVNYEGEAVAPGFSLVVFERLQQGA